MFLYLTLYIQGVLGFGPLGAGLRFLPSTLLSFLVAPLAGNLLHRVPARLLLGVGLIVVGVGLLLLHGRAPGDSWTALLPGFIVTGIGVGMTNPAIASTALGVVPAARAGMASGINSTFRQVGIATGVAGLGAVFQSRISSEVTRMLASSPPSVQRQGGQFSDAISSGAIRDAVAHAPAAARPRLTQVAESAFISGFNQILLIAAGVAILGGLLGLLLVREHDFGTAPQSAPEAEPVAV